MGYYNEVCALTSLPIYRGDACVRVHIQRRGDLSVSPSLVYVSRVQKGDYNEYGSLEELDEEIVDHDFLNVFFRQDSWEWLLSHHSYEVPPWILRDFEFDENKDLIFEWYKILVLMPFYGRSIFSGYDQGTQTPEERFDYQQSLAEFTIKHLENLKMWYEREYGESEEENHD